MKNLLIQIILLSGFAFIFVALLSALNHFFGLGLGYEGNEVPSDPEFAVAILVLGLILTPAGIFLSKRSQTRPDQK